MALNKRNLLDNAKKCKICGAASLPFDVVDFNKYCSVTDCYEFGLSGVPVTYHRCLSCSFTFTSHCDGWSTAEFAQAIYNADYIKVDGEYAAIRPRRLAEHFAGVLASCKELRQLDYGSGAGVFSGAMRAAGYLRYEEYDPFSHPHRPAGLFDLITCFEVVEHSADPIATLADIKSLLAPGGAIVISQTLQPANLDQVRGSWWYLAPRNGHISTFSEEALVIAAARLGLRYHRGDTIYGFSAGDPSLGPRRVLEIIGGSVTVLRLLAPASPAIAGWHDLEQDGVWTMRWTANDRATWSVCWPQADYVQMRVPFRAEIAPGFAAGCFMRMGQWTVPCSIDRGEIVGEFLVGAAGDGILELLTPAPKLDENATDATGRMLGLAIPCAFPALSSAPVRSAPTLLSA